MSGARAGIATKIVGREPLTMFIHWYGNALNLGVSDTIKQSPAGKNYIDTLRQAGKVDQVLPTARGRAVEVEGGGWQ